MKETVTWRWRAVGGRIRRYATGALGAAAALALAGCASIPSGQPTTKTTMLQPDQEDNLGGSFLESSDIRTISQKMCASILSLPQVSGQEGTVRIALAPIRNSSRYVIDKDILMKRLRIELNRVASDRVRFFSQGMGQEVRGEIVREQDEDAWDKLLEETAAALLASSAVADKTETMHVAVLPVKNTNLAGMNADSFASLLRAKVSEKAKGKVVFLSREANGKVTEAILNEKDVKAQGLVKAKQMKQLYGVDFFLSGELIGKSLTPEAVTKKTEGSVGQSADDPRVLEAKSAESTQSPNVAKYLEVKLLDAETGEVAFDKLVKVETKISSGLGKAEYLVTGEISALSKGSGGGDRSDYVLVSFQLVDPKSNEILWEDAYETKKKTSVSVIYK